MRRLTILITCLVAGPAAAQGCLEGRLGEGSRARRVVVQLDSPGAATVTILSRPTRATRLMSAAKPGLFAAADSTVWLERTPAGWRLFARGATDTTQTELSPAVLDDRASAFIGEWHSRVGPGGVVRLGLRLASGPCGILIGYFDSPDQGQNDLPATAIRRVGDSLVVEASYMDLRLAIPPVRGESGTAIMTQRGERTPIAITRGAVQLHRPQEPVGSRPYAEYEVRFGSAQPSITITGAITVPPTAGRHPAIILLSGSGAQDRDETVAGHRPFLVLADRLTRAGYVVLRTDDRGVGGSTGNVLQATFDDLAADVHGALRFLRGRPEVDAARIGLLGHSEGGIVAPMVASEDSAVAFVMLLAAPAVRGREFLTAQHSALARAEGGAADAIRIDSLLLEAVFDVHDRKLPDDELATAVATAIERWITALGADSVAARRMIATRSAAQDSLSLILWKSAWFKAIYHHDPTAYLRALRVPTFVTIGLLDLQVPAWQSAPRFRAAFSGARSDLLTLELPQGINHMMQPARTGKLEEYAAIEETIAPEVLAAIEAWLRRVVPPTH